jgi:hypothetical protein
VASSVPIRIHARRAEDPVIVSPSQITNSLGFQIGAAKMKKVSTSRCQ